MTSRASLGAGLTRQTPSRWILRPRSWALFPSRISSSTPQRDPQGPRAFSTTPTAFASEPGKGKDKGKGKGKGRRGDAAKTDVKADLLRRVTGRAKALPLGLKFDQWRSMRHWTIHRAWMLWRRQQRERREGELERQYQSMQNACEELRNTAGPGTRELGYLFRVAMEKKGVWHHQGIPIEYARPQTETPARVAWNHEWKR